MSEWSDLLTYFVCCLCVNRGFYLLTSCVAYCPSIDYVVNDVFSQCVAVYYTETLILCQKTSTRPKKVVDLHENVMFGCKNYLVDVCP